MKKILTTISPILILLVVVSIVFIPHTTEAAPSIWEGAANTVINSFIANVSNTLLSITSYFVTVAGIFLSISLNITLNIGNYFDGMPALKDVWILVRNLSSIFIIFVLLYTSIMTILDVGKGSVKDLVGKIIIAGLLINFSLVFVKIGIDASNLVSLQFYKAIAPGASVTANIGAAFNDGGLSDVFQASLKIPQIYNNSKVLKTADTFASISIATVAGIVMMITAALSFLAAGVAFMARTAILLFVMALSPLYFAAMIFPQLQEKSNELMKYFKNQLIFMPTYLFLMYVALRVISSPNFMTIFNQNPTGVPGASEVAFGPTFIGVAVQYIIAILFINIPLIAAIQTGGVGMKWAGDLTNSMNDWLKKRPGAIAKSTGGFAGQQVIGRGAKTMSDNIAKSNFAKDNPNLAIFANKTLSKASGASFGGSKGGYDKRFKDYSETRTKYATKSLGGVVDKSTINARMEKWDSETERLKENVKNMEAEYKTAVQYNGINSVQAKEAKKALDEARADYSKRSNRDEAERAISKELKREADKEARLKYASNLEKGGNPFTLKARKEAADKIRSEVNKKGKDKLLEDLAKELQGDGKNDGGEKKEEKS